MLTRVRDQDLRCPKCKALLGKRVGEALDIKRGAFRAIIEGAFRASLCCDQCSSLSVVVSGPGPRTDRRGPAP